MDKRSESEHLVFLDGLRGIAALYVVFFHANFIAMDRKLLLLQYGHCAVTVFITLSGFCLMLPVVRSGTMQLRDGFVGYMRRRARRILPPYYATLGFAFILPTLVGVIKVGKLQPGLKMWAPFAGWKDLFAHLTLTHNLSDRYAQNIVAPLWSVATEWQIYFVFGLLLLPVLRRWGVITVIALACILVLIPCRLLPAAHNMILARPYLLVMFAVGMAAATLTNLIELPVEQTVRKFALQIALPCLILFFLPKWVIPAEWDGRFQLDLIASLVTATLILIAFRQTDTAPKWSVRKVLSARVIVWLGTFSYSLYLTHVLTFAGLHVCLSGVRLPHYTVHILPFVAISLSLVCARLFYQFFERPFARSAQPKTVTNVGRIRNVDN